jgi:DNA polymerase-1
MKLMILDSNSILNRAFFGMPPLTTKAGEPTNAVYGFLSILLKLIQDEKPDCMVAAFDVKEKTFRHHMYDGYKAQRKAMAPELSSQIPIAKKLLDAMSIRRLEYPGFEGDDIIGTLTRKFPDVECVIVTGDRDSLQLVNDKTKVLLSVSTRSGSDSVSYGTQQVMDKYGVAPMQLIDVKAIMGDSSDNVPGVAGIGEKGASALIAKFGSLKNVYENLDDPSIKPAQRAKLEAGKESAFLSRELVTIKTDMDIDVSIEDLQIQNYHEEELFSLLTHLEFDKFIDRLGLQSKKEDVGIQVEITELACDQLLPILLDEQEIAFLSEEDKLVVFADGVLYRTIPDHAFLSALFSRETPHKITFGAKPFMRRLLELGIEAKGISFDLKVAAYVLNPSISNYSISSIMHEHLAITTDSDTTACAYFLAAADAMRKVLEDTGMLSLLEQIELPLTEVLAQMEHDGFCMDKQQLSEFGAMLHSRIEELTDTIYFMAGKKFNINSPKQLGEVLFVDLKLPAYAKTKTGFSTSMEVLERLRGYHEIIEAVLEYRRLTKLNSTYVEGFVDLIDDSGRIHSLFHQTITQTGRISSSEPNLQNIPVRHPLGRQLRKLFIAKPGYQLIDADYSQIELRVLAFMSQDEKMLSAFRTGEDIHTKTASEVFKVAPELVSSELRSRAKAVNFGIVYGISDFSLAADIKVTRKEAKQYIENYFDTYRNIKEYLDKTVINAKSCGYVTTLFGRRRYIPELSVQNHNVRSFGERVAMNTPIQGSAADLLKIAMVAVYRRLKKENMKTHIILQVHDELILESPDDEVERAKQILIEEMENAGNLGIPLKVDLGVGDNWYQAKG